MHTYCIHKNYSNESESNLGPIHDNNSRGSACALIDLHSHTISGTYIHTYIHLSAPIQKTKIIDTYYAYARAYIHTECLKQLLNLAFCNIRRKIRHFYCRLFHFSKSYIHTHTYVTYMHMKSTCRISSSMHKYTNTYIRTPPEFHS